MNEKSKQELEQLLHEAMDSVVIEEPEGYEPISVDTYKEHLQALRTSAGSNDPELYKRFMPEEIMQESKGYQRQREKILRENTIKHILVVLRTKFSADVVNAVTPEIQNISDLQRLEELYLAAARVQSIEAFAQMLRE